MSYYEENDIEEVYFNVAIIVFAGMACNFSNSALKYSVNGLIFGNNKILSDMENYKKP